MESDERLEVWKRALAREKLARKQAEQIMESKSLALYESNQKLQTLNQNLETQVEKRTQEIAQKEFEFKSLVESATEVIFKIDTGGKFLYINPVAEKLTGFRANDVIGRNFIEFVHKDHVERVYNFYEEQIANKTAYSEIEFPVVSTKGELLWFKQAATLIIRDGEPIEFVAVAHDITQVRLAQEAVAQSEEKYRGMIENLDLGVLELAKNGAILKAYPQFCMLTGYSESELNGIEMVSLFPKKHQNEITRLIDGVQLQDEQLVQEYPLSKKDGSHAWVLFSSSPFYNLDGVQMGNIVIYLDISERKKMESELRASKRRADKLYKLKEKFFANVSHEIRTPMNAIIGMSELLRESTLSPQQKKYVNAIQTSSKSLLVLVNDLLDFSKIESGKFTITNTAVSVLEVLHHIKDLLAIKADANGVVIQVECNHQVPNKIITDRTRLQQVLLNLVGNAVKFTTNGLVKVIVSLNGLQDGRCELLFKVEDEGIGISKENQSRIFESFTQANSSTAGVYGGTGLGLAISKSIVKALGGELKVRSEEGRGSTFYFSLAFDIAKDAVTSSSKGSGVMENDDFQGARVLIVEDNPVNRLIVSSNLANWNCQYVEAENGFEAIENIKTKEFDLILMDLRMPGMGGLEATKLIREELKVTTPIIALTGDVLREGKRSIESFGLTDYLSKPFIQRELNQVLAKWLSKKPITKSYVDLEALEGLGDKEFVSRMISLFISETEKDLPQIRKFVVERNENRLREFLHKVKPSVKYVCVTDVYEMVLTLEEEENIERFFKKTSRVVEILEHVVGELKST